MYKEDILDLYRNPRNEGTLDTSTEHEGENPSCGDKTHVFVEVEENKIKQIRHQTDGCAISTAGVSIISDELAGMNVDKVMKLDRDWVIDLMGIEISPMRVKCAVLGLKTVQKALE